MRWWPENRDRSFDGGDYYRERDGREVSVHNLFVRNRRVAIVIDTPKRTGLGRVTVVMVAAMVVGRITVSGIRGA